MSVEKTAGASRRLYPSLSELGVGSSGEQSVLSRVGGAISSTVAALASRVSPGGEEGGTTTGFSTRISRLGTRLVKFSSEEKWVSLHSVAEKTRREARKACVAGDLETSKRVAGLERVRLLQRMYAETDDQLKKCSFFTWLCGRIQNAFSSLLGTRSALASRVTNLFRSYSGGAFETTFGHYSVVVEEGDISVNLGDRAIVYSGSDAETRKFYSLVKLMADGSEGTKKGITRYYVKESYIREAAAR